MGKSINRHSASAKASDMRPAAARDTGFGAGEAAGGSESVGTSRALMRPPGAGEVTA